MGWLFSLLIVLGAPLSLACWGAYSIWKKEFRMSISNKFVWRDPKVALYAGVFLIAVALISYLSMAIWLIEWLRVPKHY
jgi:hypothetical protein